MNKKTLLVDGNNLYKIGFHGAKDLFYKGQHIGGVYHFINTLRKFLEQHNHDKVIVFWDDISNASARKKMYPKYKDNRRERMNEYKFDSYLYQRERVKMYLEEIFVRQVQIPNNEADDLIAYYCKIATDETIIIFSADKDLSQLISSNVTIYSPDSKVYYKLGDKIPLKNGIEIPHYNILVSKILIGDSSDNIEGIEGFGEKALLKFFPEVNEKPCTIEEILDNARNIKQKKVYKSLQNLLTGKTKSGIIGEEFYRLNKTLIDLSNPLLTDDAREIVEQIYTDTLDPTDRGYKNLMRLMMEDGLFKYLPKSDDAWVNFLRPFLKLTRKEKRNIKN